MSPLTAYLVARGIVTFALRQQQACSTAANLARALAAAPVVVRCIILLSPPRSRPAPPRVRLPPRVRGELGPIGAERRNDAAARRVLERVSVITHAVSLGDARSLITHPATTTHASMPADARATAGIGDGLLRLSVGLESAIDLERDLMDALAD